MEYPSNSRVELALTRLANEVVDDIKGQEYVEYVHSLGSEPGGSTPEEFKAFIERQDKRWESVLREMGIKIE